MVLHGLLAREIFRQSTKIFRRYYQLEGKAFNKLYTGFPKSRSIGRGVRHGLTVGSVTGSLITNDADDSPGNGIQKTIPKQYPASTPIKTRRGYTRRNGSCYPSKQSVNKYGRRTSYR